MTATRTYLTGGMGSRHRDEAFGDAHELPPDRAYTETCAAIASVMLAWRLLLATGDAVYADAIERAMFNGVLSGISSTGTEFFYTNPLQRRTHLVSGDHGRRQPWYPCACCPPNLMRLLSSWPQYLATHNDSGVQIHQYAPALVQAGPVRLEIRTDYPWDGKVSVHIVQTPSEPWTLSLRVPGWSRAEGTPDVVTYTRSWLAGESVDLDLDVSVRVTEPHRHVDAVRGCVAAERGPLVYCVEAADVPDGWELEDLRWDRGREPAEKPGGDPIGIGIPIRGGTFVSAIPYYAWGNREPGAMRVWIPWI